ncbi:CapA family protein [Streptomyces sp. NPDC051940]|uniref:CapA family protein n=1 Tax=Streptomyces sp. NPDC051940 TaxID=3155675 RepID=UPI0034165E59
MYAKHTASQPRLLLTGAALILAAAATACSAPQTPPAKDAAKAAAQRADTRADKPAAPVKKGFTLLGTGDILPHGSIIEQAQADAGGDGYEFGQMLSGVKSVVERADIAICHMETVYGGPDGPYTGYPSFKSPPQVARGVAATGYDSCSTASNHTLDAGTDGIRWTLDAMDKAGLKHTGSARTAAEGRKPAVLRAGNATVAQLAYTYGTNGYPIPEGRPWAVNLIRPQQIIADARKARRDGADVVVISLHWGSEWEEAPDAMQLRVAKQLTASRTNGRPDIDLILGTHAHVPQPYEKVNGTWVVYGMGDQIAGRMINHDNEHDPRGNWGTIARFTFAPPARPGQRWPVTKAEFLPQLMDHEVAGSPRVVSLAAAAGDGPARYAELRDRIAGIALSRGAAKDGLVMGR